MTYSSKFLVFCRQFWVAVLVLLLMGCTAPSNSSNSSEVSPSTTDTSSPETTITSEPTSSSQPKSDTSTPPGAEATAPLAQLPQLQGQATVVLKVKGQSITINVNGKDAPPHLWQFY